MPVRPDPRRARRRRPRGYLLLETLVAGGLAATVLVGTLVAAVQMRNESVLAAKKGLASSLAGRRLSQAGAIGYPAINANNTIFSTNDAADSKKYENGTEYTVATSAACGVPATTIDTETINVGVCTVTVTVTFEHMGNSIVRTDQLRLYDPA